MRMRSVWRETVAADVLAALEAGFDPAIDRRPDVLVVGGGVMGLAAAAMCKRAGLGRVVVIERSSLASGASGGAACAISPEPHVWTDPPEFVSLGRSSLELYRRLDEEWGRPFGMRMLEWLLVLPDEVPLDLARRAGLDAVGAEEARRLEPQLGDVSGAVAIGEQGHLHPLRLAAALAERSGSVATGVEMTSYESSGGRITVVHTGRGDFSPGNVVFATGLVPQPVWSGLGSPESPVDNIGERDNAAGPGIAPSRPRGPGQLGGAGQWMVKGHLVATDPAPFDMRVALSAPGGLAIQLDDGRIVLGGTLDEGDDTDQVRPEVVESIRSDLGSILPGTRELGTGHAWCCFRPRTPDGLPVIDRVPGVDNAWMTAGHYRTGVLMAPATGRAIASWMMTGRRPEEVSAFTVERFWR